MQLPGRSNAELNENNNKIVIDKMAERGVEYHVIPDNKEKTQ